MSLWWSLCVTFSLLTLTSGQLCDLLYQVNEKTPYHTNFTLSFRAPEDFLSWKLEIEFKGKVSSMQTPFLKERLTSRKWRLTSVVRSKITKGEVFSLNIIATHDSPLASKPFVVTFNDLTICSGKCSAQYKILQNDDSSWYAEYSFPVPSTSNNFTVDFTFNRPINRIMIGAVGSPEETKVDETTWRVLHNKLFLYKGWNIHGGMWVRFHQPSLPVFVSSIKCDGELICENENCEKIMTMKRFDDSGFAVKISYPAPFDAASVSTDVLLSRPLTSMKVVTPGVSQKNIENDWKRWAYEQENRKVSAGEQIEVEFWIRWRNPGPPNTIVAIRFHGENVCNLDLDEDYNGCGTVSALTVPFISGGRNAEPGEFPWHGALYLSEGANNRYICGATLVDSSVVVTAAHCVTVKKRRTPLQSYQLQLKFGKTTNYWQPSNTSQELGVSKVIVHKEYDPLTLKADIAVIILEGSTVHTQFVGPVCLANDEPLVESKGTVVGWGIKDTELSEELQKADLPVISDGDCADNHPTSKKKQPNTFCAGYKNGTNVCKGDSGGGMVFKVGSTWLLGGVVSHGINDNDDPDKCDPEYYSVFTDVRQYRRWIYDIITSN